VEVLEDTEILTLTLLTKASPGAFNPTFQIFMQLSMDDCALSSGVDKEP
jgi:hypothetical protein